MWPSCLLPAVLPTSGTAYVQPWQFPEILHAHKYTGQAWSFRKQYTTYCPSRKIKYKNVSKLHIKGREDFEKIMSEFQSGGLNPPTSVAECFHKCYHAPKPLYSILAMFGAETYGSWEEAIFSGNYPHPVSVYDLNSAYRWAACQGLPDVETGARLKQSINHWGSPHALYHIYVPPDTIPWESDGGMKILTTEDIDRFKIPLRHADYAITFDNMIDLSGVFAHIDRTFPTASKRVSQSFWGAWNSTAETMQHSWKTGEKSRVLGNYMRNPVWALYITSRVKRKLYERFSEGDVLHVFCDSIITSERGLPCSKKIGDWKLVGEYPNVWVRSPGWWGVGSETLKCSGQPKEEVLQ
jgi:hypothetical protein